MSTNWKDLEPAKDMVLNWKSFEMPKRLAVDTETLSNSYGKFIAEPFERGFGHTLGNSLRRILLSSLESYAVTSIKIDGVAHEFDRMEGVVEDGPQMIVNMRRIVFKSSVRSPKTLLIHVNHRKGPITAADIQTDGSIEVLNPNQLICTLDSEINFRMEMHVSVGRGFVPADRNKRDPQVIGEIPLDTNFSPIVRVNYYVEDSRVGQVTDYDKLVLEITTNGSVSPQDALIYAAAILKEHMAIFVDLNLAPEVEKMDVVVQDPMEQLMSKPIDELELSVRSANCLKDADIKTIGELVIKSESDLLKYRNFGKKSLDEIKAILETINLGLNMKIGGQEAKPMAEQSVE